MADEEEIKTLEELEKNTAGVQRKIPADVPRK